MSIYNAAALKEKFMTVLNDPRELEINLANVTEIDSAGVQLLMLAKRERASRNQPLILTNHSSGVLDVFELMALVGYFNDPIVLAKEKGQKGEQKYGS
jgi:anti-anti-sigma factor